jgi:hypothetical protein
VADPRRTIFLTNWSSRSLHHGTVYTIMRRPRRWELGAGRVEALTPDSRDFDDVRDGEISGAEYRRRFEAGLARHDLSPGRLGWWRTETGALVGGSVRDGDTLCCACGREAAARGECHRVWSAHALARAGWNVVLDGTLLLVARSDAATGEAPIEPTIGTGGSLVARITRETPERVGVKRG